MKHFTLIIATVLSSFSLVAQPQIENGANLPEPGTTFTFSVSLTSNPGPAGADQVWDFGTLPSAFIADGEIIDPANSPLIGSFPSADFTYTLSVDGEVGYSFFNVTVSKMEVMAYVVAAPGGENDYSPNPRTLLKFPFDFQEEVMDTWQESGNSENTVTVTYDGYGTLITPGGTFENVVRIRENYGDGEDDYQWFTLDPLMQVAIFDHNDEVLFTVGGLSTGLEDKTNALAIDIFPNPAKDFMNIRLPESEWSGNTGFAILDLTGRVVQHGVIASSVTRIDLAERTPGVYFIRLSRNGQNVANSKLILK